VRFLRGLLRYRGLTAVAVLVLALGLGDAFWLEPRVLLLRADVRIDLPAPRLRAVHLSDIHVVRDRPLLHRLIDEVRAARPDVILVSGDVIRDVPEPERLARRLDATAAFMAALRRIAPVIAVQGHSEHQGEVVTRLDQAGVQWLSNEGRRIGPGGGILLLGLNQQVGLDDRGRSSSRQWPKPFHPFRHKGEWIYGARQGAPFINFYTHWDPEPAGLADEGGPLAWSGTDLVCDVWIEHTDVGAGLIVHSRYVLGEDRMYRLRRVRAEDGGTGSFVLVAHGTTLTGKVDTGVEPEAGRWYRMRLRTEVEPGAVRLLARVWPADRPEPREWQARAEDRSRFRVESGTVGLWGWGGGTVLYRNVKVTGAGGEALLDAPLTGRKEPPGWQQGARGTRLAMALARSPYVPPGTPHVVLSHTPDVVIEAARRGLDAVLAGHTHGGQVRLPFIGALTTRNPLGAYYDFGRFEFPAPNARGTTPLYINPGVGTSVLPVRFWCPPGWAVVELGRWAAEKDSKDIEDIKDSKDAAAGSAGVP
jgi:predicted MPP superfamily phosphohydrolase